MDRMPRAECCRGVSMRAVRWGARVCRWGLRGNQGYWSRKSKSKWLEKALQGHQGSGVHDLEAKAEIGMLDVHALRYYMCACALYIKGGRFFTPHTSQKSKPIFTPLWIILKIYAPAGQPLMVTPIVFCGFSETCPIGRGQTSVPYSYLPCRIMKKTWTSGTKG